MFNKYPYTDMHELNLDWILAKMKELDEKVDDFTALNAIKWEGDWDPNKSYEAWSIVRNNDGSAYISLKAVPAGVLLTSEEYWALAFDYEELYTDFIRRMDAIEENTQTMIDDAMADIDALISNTAGSIASLQAQQDVLSARMDEFTNLPEGSTTGDAELADIRVGADGITYANAGDAVRDQFLEVKNAVGFMDPDIEWTDGKYINYTTGTVGTGNTWSITSMIPCVPGQLITIRTTIAINAGIAEYDENGTYITGYSVNDTIGVNEYQFKASGRFFRFSCRTEEKVFAWVHINDAPIMPDIAASAETIDALTEDTYNLWTAGDQTISNSARVVVYSQTFPAGDYTMSAVVNRAVQSSGNCRMRFYKDSITTVNLLAQPYIAAESRNYASFTLSDEANIVVLMYATSDSVTGTCTWHDIMITAGSKQLSYLPPVTAIDYDAREAVTPYAQASDLIKTHNAGTVTYSFNNSRITNNPVILHLDAKYITADDSIYPYGYFSIVTDRGLTRSSSYYKLGNNGTFRLQEIRSIPYIWDTRDFTFTIVVPADCSLIVKNAYITQETGRRHTISGLQFHAHDGSCNVAPRQSISAVRMAESASYNSFIVIPKVTSDGVWFAYHDDRFNIADTYLVNADGSAIESSPYDGDYFSDIPWSYLQPLLAGSRYGAQFADEHLMRLDDFFMLCAKTGLSPMFSMHPRYGIQTVSKLNSLKDLVTRYGILDKLIIKMPLIDEGGGVFSLSNFTTIFSVFGNDIARYEVDAVDGMDDPGSVITLFDGVSESCTVPKTIEWWTGQIYADPSLASAALTAGYAVSAAQQSHTDPSGLTVSFFTSEDVRYLASIGVSEFTDEYFTCSGLDF